MSDDLVEWLRAQLAADERGWTLLANAPRNKVGNTIADRMLRDVAAVRKILARHEPIEVFGQLLCTYCGVTKGASRPDASWPCPDLRDLAEVFSDRPGYRENWRPA